jgi:hypothetical protein
MPLVYILYYTLLFVNAFLKTSKFFSLCAVAGAGCALHGLVLALFDGIDGAVAIADAARDAFFIVYGKFAFAAYQYSAMRALNVAGAAGNANLEID